MTAQTHAKVTRTRQAAQRTRREREGTAHTHAPTNTPRPGSVSRAPISFAPGAGIAASKYRAGVKCPGCTVAHPPALCSACGLAPTVIALDAGAHAMTFCRDCARTLLAARAEGRREMAEETRERMAAAARERHMALGHTPGGKPGHRHNAHPRQQTEGGAA